MGLLVVVIFIYLYFISFSLNLHAFFLHVQIFINLFSSCQFFVLFCYIMSEYDDTHFSLCAFQFHFHIFYFFLLRTLGMKTRVGLYTFFMLTELSCVRLEKFSLKMFLKPSKIELLCLLTYLIKKSFMEAIKINLI